MTDVTIYDVLLWETVGKMQKCIKSLYLVGPYITIESIRNLLEKYDIEFNNKLRV